MLAAKDHDLPLFSQKMPMAMEKAVDMMNSANYYMQISDNPRSLARMGNTHSRCRSVSGGNGASFWCLGCAMAKGRG
jgi:hypothetical protein